jgi:Winged helix DNA-binding domain
MTGIVAAMSSGVTMALVCHIRAPERAGAWGRYGRHPMTPSEVALRRVAAQHIGATELRHPRQVVARLGAVQAQDYLGALWAVGLRLGEAGEAAVEDALAERTIVRSWPMRGTLHLVAAEDLRWLLALLGPRVVARAARRYQELELDAATFARGRRLLERALQDGRCLTRAEVYAVLAAGRVSTAGQRGIHLLQRLALDGVLCFGPRRGKQHTFALLEAWLPAPRTPGPSGDEALAQLARRYFTGHGPASLADFGWWSGLAAAQARRAVELAGGHLETLRLGEAVLFTGRAPPPPQRRRQLVLLPGFDELWVGYQDRTAHLDAVHHARVNPGANGLLRPTLVLDGRVVGTWRRTLSARGVAVAAAPFGALGREARRQLQAASEAYARFLGRPLHAVGLED